MSLKNISNMQYLGDTALLPPASAPMPASAKYYADFVRSLFISNLSGNINKSADYATVMQFARSTTASYINNANALVYAAVNIPRIDRNPITLAILGLRVEDATFNYAQYPGNQLASNYVASGMTVTDAGNGWFQLTESTVNEIHVLTETSAAMMATTSYPNTVSIRAKSGTARYLQIQMLGVGANAYANFDLLTGSVTALGSLVFAANISEDVNNSWRCEVCCLAFGSGSTESNIKYSLINGPTDAPATAYPGTGRTIAVSVAQLEQGYYFASSPYAPAGINVNLSRSNDVAQIADLTGAEQTGFAIFVKGIFPGAPQGNGSGNILFSINNPDTKKYVNFGTGSRGGSFPFMSFYSHNYTDAGTEAKVGFTGPTYSKYGEYSLIISVNNGILKIYSGQTDAPETLLTNLLAIERIYLGSGSVVASSTGLLRNVGAWGGCISNFCYYPHPLGDSVLMTEFEKLS